METRKKPFSKGDWVEVVNTNLRGCTGYILNLLLDEEGYKVKITADQRGKHIEGVIWIAKEDLVPCVNLVDEHDLLTLIDLALVTNDKQWFLELTDQLPEKLLF
ncbi:IDEAL domain-containing protein [Cytobacillus firmus]|uniref:IDEAL domain-containing protein n=2 Tax=Cytobacillus TaxID=2675230 RepID=A0A366JGY8_CYTFI|nr:MULTISPECIES: IDEAL domain-containing protein [Cytobacillus]RBP86067.1 IDEAL domain-containing protein [Cytobacillus firmus]TDX35410.1 IDEAL domain-containing protein [Cytobacillus oceanisediminis]